MKVPYMVGLARRPQPALGGSLARPRSTLMPSSAGRTQRSFSFRIARSPA